MDLTFIVGGLAIVAAIANVILSLMKRDGTVFMYISLSLTALTMCFAYDQIIGLERDLVLSSEVWFEMTIASILINGIGLFGRRKR